jgi:DNA-binding CsgD family transcriptional regulator
MKIRFDDNIFSNPPNKLIKICNPLQKILDIPFFRYGKIFNDGSRFFLCNQPDVMRFIYQDGNYPLSWHDNGKKAGEYEEGCVIWATKKIQSTEEQRLMESKMKNFFKVSEGITYRVRSSNFIEIYDFAGNDPSIYNVNSQTFKHFMYYFKEQANSLIKSAEHEKKIILPPNVQEIQLPSTKEKEVELIKNLVIKRHYLGENYNHAYLTTQEVHCINWYVKGKSAKEIAQIINRSEKTINRHLENIKQKLGCHKKYELVKIALEIGVL